MGKVSLFCKHEGLSSNIQHPWENLDMAVRACNFSTRGRDRQILGAHCPGGLSCILVQRESLLKTVRQRVTENTPRDVLLWLPHVQFTLACTSMHYSQSPTYKHTADIFNLWLVEYVGKKPTAMEG